MREKAPRLSASGAKRDNECPSSVTRSLELYSFLEKMDIDGSCGSGDANRGTAIHAVCAKIPVPLPDFGGCEVFDIRARVDALVPDMLADGSLEMNLSGFERYIVTNFVEKRDAFINSVLDAHPLGRDGVEQVEISLDDRRLYLPFTAAGDALPMSDTWPAQGALPLQEKSGLPDVHLVVRGGGISIIGILDYKSGIQEYDPADNDQINDLLGLAAITEFRENGVAPTAGYGAFAYEADLGGPLSIAKFSDQDLAKAQKNIREASKPAIAFANRFTDLKTGEPGPALDHDLDKAAKTGSHCLHCRGKMCCGALKITGAQLEYALQHKYDSILTQSLKDPSGTVNTKTISDVLHMTEAISTITAAYAKMQEDALEITRQLYAEGESIENVEVVPGKKRVVTNGETPASIHAKVLKLTGEDYSTFIQNVDITISASSLRAYLAAKMGKKEKEVMEDMEKLGEAAPIANTFNKPSVKVTGELTDIVQQVAYEIQERHAAFASGKLKATTTVAPAPATGVQLPEREANVSTAQAVPPETDAAAKPARRPRKRAASLDGAAAPATLAEQPKIVPIEEEASPALGEEADLCASAPIPGLGNCC